MCVESSTDIFSPEKRSEIMSRVRSTNTKPEITVRSFLHRLGYRFRLHRQDLPGKPDIVLPKYRLVIFVNGCFWHQHTGCKKATIPKNNRAFWEAKLWRNIERDKLVHKELKDKGWNVLVIWECEAKKDLELIAHKIEQLTDIE
jgi:DNA mismatch endonuclease (patch repair protein)